MKIPSSVSHQIANGTHFDSFEEAVQKQLHEAEARIEAIQRQQGLPSPGTHIEIGVSPSLRIANSWGIPSDLALAAGDSTYTFASKEEKPRMLGMTNAEFTYEGTDGRGRVRMRVEFELPPNMNPNEVLAWLKRGDFLFTPQSAESAPDPAIERRISQITQHAAELQDMLEVQRKEMSVVLQKATTHEKVLLKIRKRMNLAMEALQDRDVATELYEEIVNRWARALVESATFTAAEGKELVEALVSALEYMDMVRETRRLERSEHSCTSSSESPDDHLF
jgi:hypothetical protein